MLGLYVSLSLVLLWKTIKKGWNFNSKNKMYKNLNLSWVESFHSGYGTVRCAVFERLGFPFCFEVPGDLMYSCWKDLRKRGFSWQKAFGFVWFFRFIYRLHCTLKWKANTLNIKLVIISKEVSGWTPSHWNNVRLHYSLKLITSKLFK